VRHSLRFIEIEEFRGNRNSSFFFPQYLIKAIFDGAIAVNFIVLYYSSSEAEGRIEKFVV